MKRIRHTGNEILLTDDLENNSDYMLDNFDEQEIKEYEEIESKFIENKYLIKWNEQ